MEFWIQIVQSGGGGQTRRPLILAASSALRHATSKAAAAAASNTVTVGSGGDGEGPSSSSGWTCLSSCLAAFGVSWRCRLPSSFWLKPHETHLRKCWLKYIVILLIRSMFLCFALLLLNALINMRSKSTSYLLTKSDRGFAVLQRQWQCECLARCRWKGKESEVRLV